MSSTEEIRSAIDNATVPESDALDRARMIVVDKLGEWDSLGVDELVESVCEAYEAHSGEPLRLSDVDPSAPATDTPALRNLRYARAARTAIIDLHREGTIVPVAEHPGDAEEVDLTGERDEHGGVGHGGKGHGGKGHGGNENGGNVHDPDHDDDEVTATKETTGPAGREAGADEIVLSTGPQPQGRRFALASR
ncbi:hypothetical protein [Dietzia sp. PP-33]|jgi:hypothetical protein|uniref:hypothetical protein n=1 Tax=Dietzia sp. PP-33 TaxID=2957500 RepID=UPI0029AA0D0B|nr:hypothetical protein [Dietzia sp. PP-33]MDX2357335.1 hypothetical protein [Dietzia sp. PP-33]